MKNGKGTDFQDIMSLRPAKAELPELPVLAEIPSAGVIVEAPEGAAAVWSFFAGVPFGILRQVTESFRNPKP